MKNTPLSTRLNLVADILTFGQNWLEDYEDGHDQDTIQDAVAHIAACAICQYFINEYPGVLNGVGTVETRDYFFQGGLAPRKELPLVVLKYLDDWYKS